jgi:hypothetical protein
MQIIYEPFHLNKLRFVQWKIVDIPTSFIWIIFLFDGALEYEDVAKFWGYVRTNAEPLFVKFCKFWIVFFCKSLACCY